MKAMKGISIESFMVKDLKVDAWVNWLSCDLDIEEEVEEEDADEGGEEQ